MTEVVQRCLLRDEYRVSIAAHKSAALKAARGGTSSLDGLRGRRQLRADNSVPTRTPLAEHEESDNTRGGRIVKSHDGWMWAERESEQGRSVELRFVERIRGKIRQRGWLVSEEESQGAEG